ncbi:DUF3857 domain-containing protein [Thalassotalea sp. HSM 43]|uniref:DUF3857 domain-containing transglutaminase family protein n=1 Tax=Thalassotalea sp. HSM 43 TaxID=2552945 RepID=UPI0010800BC5|nr:DUF3857 and transglutaminase domain-containing protein [Thalassotalea sp. HSM 43]QBY05172.1 DUF3857 domain-containing protein [Thalassotalea sp. HSM 43]
MKKSQLCCALTLSASFGLAAEPVEYLELQSKIKKLNVEYTVNEDFTVERTTELEVVALNDNVAKELKNYSFNYSTSIEKLKVIEAKTINADGSEVMVPEGNYQESINRGHNDNQAIYSDRTSLTVVFPELDANDAIYVKSKIVEIEPMFPGHFAIAESVWDHTAYDELNITIRMPDDVVIYQQFNGVEKSVSKDGDSKVIRVSYSNPKPIKGKRNDYSTWNANTSKGFIVSTFASYQEVADAYAKRALPQAEVTDRVQKLADEITADLVDKKQMAKALYEWVATNISYAGNCIGVGAVVPHHVNFILDNRMGDCKDHATLLEAFYKAKGIDSSQALINSGNQYVLPDVALVSAVNHVITYLPEWDMFIDSTNPHMPFESLAFNIADKPVIMIDERYKVAKTPATKVGENKQSLTSKMTINANGSVTGDLQISAQGRAAIDLRASFRMITEQQEKEWLERTFSSRNQLGKATLTKDDPKPLKSDFNYSFEFERPEFIQSSGAGGFHVYPFVLTSGALFNYLDYSQEELVTDVIACMNGFSEEELVYELPQNLKILAKPDNFAINENHIEFKASYEQEGNVLTVKRFVNDTTPGNLCSADLVNAQRKTLMKINENLNSQVIFQFTTVSVGG